MSTSSGDPNPIQIDIAPSLQSVSTTLDDLKQYLYHQIGHIKPHPQKDSCIQYILNIVKYTRYPNTGSSVTISTREIPEFHVLRCIPDDVSDSGDAQAINEITFKISENSATAFNVVIKGFCSHSDLLLVTRKTNNTKNTINRYHIDCPKHKCVSRYLSKIAIYIMTHVHKYEVDNNKIK